MDGDDRDDIDDEFAEAQLRGLSHHADGRYSTPETAPRARSRGRPRAPRLPKNRADVMMVPPDVLRLTEDGYQGLLPGLLSVHCNNPVLENVRVRLIDEILALYCPAIGYSPEESGSAAVKRVCNATKIPAEKQAWIVPLVGAIEMACLARCSEQLRDAKVAPIGRPRFRRVESYAEQAKWVLDETRKVAPGIPSFITPELVILFIARCGFSTGGGPKRVISRDTLTAWLADPPKLVAALREYRQPRFRAMADAVEASTAGAAQPLV